MKKIKKLGFAVYAIAALSILGIGTSELVAQASAGICWDPPLSVGTCPGDYANDMDCRTACIEVYEQFWGACDPIAKCCFCFE